MAYVGEFRKYWRYWAGAALGVGVGAGIQMYTGSLFGPPMIAEFGWSKSVYALQGATALAMFLVIPFIGRLTDTLGVRKVAAVGVIALPLTLVANSLQNGDVALFLTLAVLNVLASAATTGVVYCRLVAISFTAARGLALAVCATAPAAIMVVMMPILGAVVEHFGWRVGYQSMAVFCLSLGLLAIWIIPTTTKSRGAPKSSPAGPVPANGRIVRSPGLYHQICRTPVFWLICAGMVMCNMCTAVIMNQFGLMLIEQGVHQATLGWILSIFATSVVIGRFAGGLALDCLPTHWVAAICMGAPGVGLLILGQKFGVLPVVIGAAGLIGLSQGAETDLMQYLVAKYFPQEIFSTVSGLVMGALALSIVLGALLVSGVLHLTDSYLPFLTASGLLALMGGALLTNLNNPRLQWRTTAEEVSI